jgi:ADP-heptose:LPS heptosyltransferase
LPFLQSRSDVCEIGSQFKDFADTAAAIALLDAVIAVDTAVAHLAGAMGKPLFLLLPFAADFRWLRERADSPWYPTARLFRQPQFGDWDSVVKVLRQELARLGILCGRAA